MSQPAFEILLVSNDPKLLATLSKVLHADNVTFALERNAGDARQSLNAHPADLLLVDYFPPTPIDSFNLFGHLLFGVSNAPVDSLMVNGRWVLRGGHCVNLDERAIAEKAAARAKALWERF